MILVIDIFAQNFSQFKILKCWKVSEIGARRKTFGFLDEELIKLTEMNW